MEKITRFDLLLQVKVMIQVEIVTNFRKWGLRTGDTFASAQVCSIY